jgi:hypothetical protein
VVNPNFDASFHEVRTGTNFHLAYSPQALNSGAEGWKIQHQIALFANKGFVVPIGRRHH